MLTALPPTFFQENALRVTHVADDVHCIGCGYNLRTLAVDGRCPECGKSVGDTIRLLISRWAESWRAVLYCAQLCGVALALSLLAVAIANIEAKLGVVASPLDLLYCLFLVTGPLYYLCAAAMLIFIRNVVPVTYRWYTAVPILLAVALLTIKLNSFSLAVGWLLAPTLLLAPPTWSSWHIAEVSGSVGATTVVKLAWCNLWLGRIVFWVAYVSMWLPRVPRGVIVLYGSPVVILLHTVVLWTFASRIGAIVRSVKCAEGGGYQP